MKEPELDLADRLMFALFGLQDSMRSPHTQGTVSAQIMKALDMYYGERGPERTRRVIVQSLADKQVDAMAAYEQAKGKAQ